MNEQLTHDEIKRLRELLRLRRECEDYKLSRRLVGKRRARRMHPEGYKENQR